MLARPVIALVAVVAACAGATTQARQPACPLRQADSVYLAGGSIYRDCAVDRRAHLRNPQVLPDFEPRELPAGGFACYSAVIEVVVDTSGVPESGTAHIVYTNNRIFADAVLLTVVQWRYDPARKGTAAVRQIVQQRRVLGLQLVAAAPGAMPRPPSRRPQC